MRFPKLSRHAALGLGAMGLVIASSGVTALASNLASPAGALSVQVPAVAVREQNVNAAGRIRVALPKTSVGVNGSVSVNNLPENSSGRLQVSAQPATGGFARVSDQVLSGNGAPDTVVNYTGSGVLTAMQFWGWFGTASTPGDWCVNVYADGNPAFSDCIFNVATAFSTPFYGGGSTVGGHHYLYFSPAAGVPFEHSLVIQLHTCCGTVATSHVSGRVFWHQTN